MISSVFDTRAARPATRTAIRKAAPNTDASGCPMLAISSAVSAAVGVTPVSNTCVPTVTAAPGAV